MSCSVFEIVIFLFQLFALQSRFGVDERFKIDSRFADNDNEDSEIAGKLSKICN